MTDGPEAISAPGDPRDPDGWHLRPATLADVDGVHRLAGEPRVYRYLFDGRAPGATPLPKALATPSPMPRARG